MLNAFHMWTRAFDKSSLSQCLYVSDNQKICAGEILPTTKVMLREEILQNQSRQSCFTIPPDEICSTTRECVRSITIHNLYTWYIHKIKHSSGNIRGWYLNHDHAWRFYYSISSLQDHLFELEHWFKRWRIEINERKSKHIIFTRNTQNYPYVFFNGIKILTHSSIKYIGMH